MAGLSSDYIPSFSTMLLDKHKSANFWYETKCPRCGGDDIIEKTIDDKENNKRNTYMVCEKCGYMKKAPKKSKR
jgi:predicted RNA-binding Zn-ribbon protein involved in translation (DUF1610 family)